MRRRDKRKKAQRGHLMAGLMASVAIMMILSTAAFQAWVEVLRRDNEAEMMFRAQDLVRAIQRFRRDHGGVGPLQLDLLMEPGPKGQYYARKLWTDPLVKNGEWGLLHVAPGGQIIDPSAQGAGGPSALNPNASSTPSSQRISGESAAGLTGSGSGLQNIGGPGNSGGLPGNQGQQGNRGQGNSSVFGGQQGESGLPIAGVKSLATDRPFRVYNGLTEYSEWLFTYLDLEQQQIPGQTGQPGQPGQPRPGGPGVGGRPGGRPGNQLGNPSGGQPGQPGSLNRPNKPRR